MPPAFSLCTPIFLGFALHRRCRPTKNAASSKRNFCMSLMLRKLNDYPDQEKEHMQGLGQEGDNLDW